MIKTLAKMKQSVYHIQLNFEIDFVFADEGSLGQLEDDFKVGGCNSGHAYSQVTLMQG